MPNEDNTLNLNTFSKFHAMGETSPCEDGGQGNPVSLLFNRLKSLDPGLRGDTLLFLARNQFEIGSI